MKQVRNGFFGLSVFLFSSCIFATAHFAFSCPDKFIGKVVKVDEISGSTLPKVEVSFQVLQSLKGDVFESKKIQVVKDGPIEFKVGQSYTMETREGWLCNAENTIK